MCQAIILFFYITLAGPTKDMIDDFWRMVWQQKADKIVMLTNLIEMGQVRIISKKKTCGGCQYIYIYVVTCGMLLCIEIPI